MKKTRIKHQGARVGDMRHRVLIQDRTITPPVYESVDFTMAFASSGVWAAIKTTRNNPVFNGVGQDVSASHEVTVRSQAGIEAGTFVQLEDGRRLRVVEAQDFGNRNEYIVMICSERGLGGAAQA